MTARNVTLGTLGALMGAAGLIWVGYWWDGDAKAQPPSPPGGNMADKITPPPAQPPSGASGNFSIGQKGGTVHQTYINQAPPDLIFNSGLAAELLAKIPKDKPIFVQIVGPKQSDLITGLQIKEFLVANGYKVQFSSTMNMLPQPEHKLDWDAAASVLTIAPSVK